MADKYDIENLLSTVVDEKPVEFAKAFNDILVDKVTTAVNDRKTEIAQNIFNEPDEEENEELEDDEPEVEEGSDEEE